MPRSAHSVQKGEYQYEYECEEVIVRRYDRANLVVLELVRDGKVIDKVKARISRQDKSHSIFFDLYFTYYHAVIIVPEYNPNMSDCKVRFRRSWIKTVFKKKRDGFFDLNYFGDKSFRTVWWLKQHLRDLSFLKKRGCYYPIDLCCAGLDTLYNHDGANPVAVKMRVVDEYGSILYSNGI